MGTVETVIWCIVQIAVLIILIFSTRKKYSPKATGKLVILHDEEGNTGFAVSLSSEEVFGLHDGDSIYLEVEGTSEFHGLLREDVK